MDDNATIERCALICDELAAEADQNMKLENDVRFGVYAKKYRNAAQRIRDLKEPSHMRPPFRMS